jgi:uncharacterized protein (TIGR04141 family)
MRLSLYLFRDDVTSFDDLLLPDRLTGAGAFQEISPTRKLPYPCCAFLQNKRSQPPRWTKFLAGHFDAADLRVRSASSSFVLFIKAKKRVFAATFGYGFLALDRSRLEPSFGLRVTLNAVDPERLTALDTRNIDLVTRQRRTHVSVGSPVSEFDFDVDLEWVRAVVGKPSSKKLAKTLGGTDSLSIDGAHPLETLGALCEELLQLHASDRYKSHFDFIDHVQPLPKNHPALATLEPKLVRLIKDRSLDRIAVAYPEIPDPRQLVTHRIAYGRDHQEFEDLTLLEVYGFLDAHRRAESSLDQLYVTGLDDDDLPVTKRYALREYLVCEIADGNATYILSLGQWFRGSSDYVSEVRARVARIPDVSSELDLPALTPDEPEGAYNARAGTAKGWLLLDRGNVAAGGPYDKIEVCDLITPALDFIAVKKMRSSATLSHLFAQGSVSATLLRSHDDYRRSVRQVVTNRWANAAAAFDANRMRFVYAMPTHKLGPVDQCLFFFSLVNLLSHQRTITTAGYPTAVCKIGYAP